jgi:cobalamin synthase
MKQTISKQIPDSQRVLKHSSLGVSAFVLSIFALIFNILLLISVSQNGTPSPIIWFILFACLITSTVLAIVDLTKCDRKKALSIWALILDWGFLVLLIIIGIASLIGYKIISG